MSIGGQKGGQNIIVLFDGTAAKLGDRTNIERLKSSLIDNENLFYYPGTDTVSSAENQQKLVATELKRDVKNAYEALQRLDIHTHDKIHIFGYSRGSISARTLAQAITSPVYYMELFKGHQLDRDNLLNHSVEVLSVLDPIFGKLNPFTGAPNHEISASKNPRILSYIEIVACDEHRFVFAHRSSAYAFIKRLNESKPKKNIANAESKVPSYYLSQLNEVSSDGPKSFQLKESRHFIAMRGGHADIGNQAGDEVIGNHALLTMCTLAVYCSKTLKSSFVSGALSDFLDYIDLAGKPKPNSSLSGFRRAQRAISGLGKEFFRRKRLVNLEVFVHHSINNECAGKKKSEAVFTPDYRAALE